MQLCCIFLLLFAQQAALTHALWHTHAAGPTHAPEAASEQSHGHEESE